MPEPSPLPWYALRLRSNHEQNASRLLQDKGFTTLVPLYRIRRKWSDRTKEIEVPLFRGYIFCQLDVIHQLPILTTPGVVSILGSSEGPVPIDEAEMAAVRTLVHSGLPVGPWPFVQKGQPVVVERGPLQGAEGIVVELKDRYQLVVSISLLQRSVWVQIDRECVRPLAQQKAHPLSRSVGGT